MIDSTTQSPMTVSTDGGAGPYLIVPIDQLESVTSILRNNHIPFWEDSFSVTVNGTPEVVSVNFGSGVDAVQVQRLLDAAA
jgi:hypothetical protein